MQRHKSPGSLPATSGFIEPTANALPEITSSTWGCYVALRCALEELQSVKPQLDSQQGTKSFFFICSRANWTSLRSLIFISPPLDQPPNISKAQCPNPMLLGTVLSSSHCGFVLLEGAARDQDLPNWCKKSQRMRQNSTAMWGFFYYYSKEDAAQKHLMICQAHQESYLW